MPTNDTPHDDTPLSTQWTPPDPQLVRAAIERSLKRRPKRIYRPIVVKLHNPSQRKVDALLWAQRHVTNMISHILEALRETPGQYRPDGAFACIAELYARRAQGAKVDSTILLADILSQRFRGKQ